MTEEEQFEINLHESVKPLIRIRWLNFYDKINETTHSLRIPDSYSVDCVIDKMKKVIEDNPDTISDVYVEDASDYAYRHRITPYYERSTMSERLFRFIKIFF